METPVSYKDVEEAAKRLTGVVRQTPLLHSEHLSERIGRDVFVKCEPLQLTGSFKIRGAYNRISRFTEDERKRGAVAFSSGNHAQGVARAAKLIGTPACIVMPKDTPQVKIDGVRRDGAEIVFYDRLTESREEIAGRLSKERGAVLVPSYDDAYIIAGQGSCGVEIVQQWGKQAPPSGLICPIGGGGLIAGISLALKAHWPATEIWGAEPEDYDDYARSLSSGEIEHNSGHAHSICDALQSPSPGNLTFAVNKTSLCGVGLVSDNEVKDAVRFAFRYLKIVAEPGGAAALAALLSSKVRPSDDGSLVVVISGGNIDPAMFADILKGEGA